MDLSQSILPCSGPADIHGENVWIAKCDDEEEARIELLGYVFLMIPSITAPDFTVEEGEIDYPMRKGIETHSVRIALIVGVDESRPSDCLGDLRMLDTIQPHPRLETPAQKAPALYSMLLVWPVYQLFEFRQMNSKARTAVASLQE